MKCDFGEFWSYDQEEPSIQLSTPAYTPHPLHQDFHTQSRKMGLNHLNGLSGTVAREKEYIWVEKIQESSLFQRKELATQYGLKTALAVPIKAGADVLGVLILFKGKHHPEDPKVVNFVTRVASQLSSYLLHRQAVEARQQAIIDANRANLLSMLQATFESSPDGILVVDNEAGVLNYNEKLQKMWKISEEAMESKLTVNIFAEMETQVKDPEQFMEGIKVLTTHPELPSYDIFEFKDDRVLERFSRPFQQDEGSSSGRVWFFHDITDRTQAEKALRENERKYRTLFSQANDAILLIQNERFIDCNEKTGAMFGGSADEIIGESIHKLSPRYQPDGKQSKVLLQARIQAAANQKPQFFYWQHLRMDGAPFDTEVSMNYLEIDSQPFVQIMVRDISERLQAERALRDSEAKNQAILDALPDLMFILSKDGYVLDFKENGDETLVMNSLQIVNQKVAEFLPEELADLTLEHVKKALSQKGLSTFEYELETNLGLRHLEARLVPSGESEVLAIVRNVTERKQAENELIQRNFELDSFVYRASHDLKAPLNSIMGLIEILRMETEEASILSYLTLMDRSVTKLDSFIRDLTDFSRNERMEVITTEINFEEVVNECIDNLSFMKNAARIKISTRISHTAPFYSDRVRIHIILNNLISNAVKYQDLNKENPYANIIIDCTEDEATIIIEDNGMGISQEHHEKIFNMFYRASFQAFGTGLGMYIVKNAVQKVKGKISLESELDKGTTFTVVIPNSVVPPPESSTATTSTS